MRHKLGILVAVAMCCAGSALAQGAPCEIAADATGVAAEIVALTGQGETRARQAEAWSAARLAQSLNPGADLRTLALSSAALLLADHTQIRMAANALVRLCDARPGQTRLELAAGRLWARTKGQPAGCSCRPRRHWRRCAAPIGTLKWMPRGAPR